MDHACSISWFVPCARPAAGGERGRRQSAGVSRRSARLSIRDGIPVMLEEEARLLETTILCWSARCSSRDSGALRLIAPAGQVLLPIAGKPMLQWVYERACAAQAEEVVIATDDERVASSARGFAAGAHDRRRACIGTDRWLKLRAAWDGPSAISGQRPGR